MANPIDNKAKQPSKTTGFTNIQDIVKANRQNRLGQAVSTGVSNVVGQNQQQLGQAKTQFQQESEKNQFGTGADKQMVENTLQNPVQADSGTIDRFAQFRSGQYQGPQELTNRDQLQAGQQDVQSLADASKDEYGRRGLLQRFVSPNQYTQGQQRLDNLLLGQTGGKALNQAKREANLYGRELTEAEKSAQAQATGLSEQARQFGQFVQGRLGEEETGLQSSIDQRVAQQKTEAENARAALQALFTKDPNDKISQEQYDSAKSLLERLGMGDRSVYGAENFVGTPEELLGQGIVDPTRLSVGTEEEKAKSLALAKLAGKQQGLYGAEDKVGGYDSASFLDKENLEKVLGRGKEKYDAAFKQRQGSNQRVDDLMRYEREMRQAQQDMQTRHPLESQLQQLEQDKINFGLDPQRKAQIDQQIASIKANPEVQAAQQKRAQAQANAQQLNTWRLTGLHLGEDEFGSVNANDPRYPYMMAAKIEEAKADIARQNEELTKYGGSTFLDRLKGMIK